MKNVRRKNSLRMPDGVENSAAPGRGIGGQDRR